MNRELSRKQLLRVAGALAALFVVVLLVLLSSAATADTFPQTGTASSLKSGNLGGKAICPFLVKNGSTTEATIDCTGTESVASGYAAGAGVGDTVASTTVLQGKSGTTTLGRMVGGPFGGDNYLAITTNAFWNAGAWHQDNAALPSWFFILGDGPTDDFAVYRTPAGGAPALRLEVDSSGNAIATGGLQGTMVSDSSGFPRVILNVNGSMGYIGNAANGATAVGHDFNTNPPYTTAGALLARWRNSGTLKASIDKDGNGLFANLRTTLSGSLSPSRLVADYATLTYPMIAGAVITPSNGSVTAAELVYMPGASGSDQSVTWEVYDLTSTTVLCTYTDTKGCTNGTFTSMKRQALSCSGTYAAGDELQVRIASAAGGCNPGYSSFNALLK